MLLFISYQLIRYESSRGHKIDGTKPNQTGNTFGDKQGKQTEENVQESSQQRTSSRSTRNKKHKQKKQTKGNHIKRSSAGYAREAALQAAEYNPRMERYFTKISHLRHYRNFIRDHGNTKSGSRVPMCCLDWTTHLLRVANRS